MLNEKVKSRIRRTTPYTPGEQPHAAGVIKLNTNENPYPPSPMILASLDKIKAKYAEIRLYPSPDASSLKTALAAYTAENSGVNLSKENIFIGVGSDDVLAMAFMTFFNRDDSVFFPDITYSFYDVWCDLFNISYKKIPLSDDFKLTLSDYTELSAKKNAGGIIIANPNAPTGIYESVEFIEEIVKTNPDCIVMVDEAYIDFAGTSAVSLIDKYSNLLVIRTYSKSRAAAGLRVGYALGHAELIKALENIKYSYNSYTLSSPVLSMAEEILKDETYFKETLTKIISERERAKEKLASLGFSFPDSKANFIFASHKSVKADYIFDELKKRKIYIRYFNSARINNYLRITVGTKNEMNRLYEALSDILS